MIAWAGTPSRPPNSAQPRLAGRDPEREPNRQRDHCERADLPGGDGADLRPRQAERTQHGEVAPPPPARHHDELRQHSKAQRGEQAAEHLRRGVDAGVVGDSVRLLAGDDAGGLLHGGADRAEQALEPRGRGPLAPTRLEPDEHELEAWSDISGTDLRCERGGGGLCALAEVGRGKTALAKVGEDGAPDDVKAPPAVAGDYGHPLADPLA